MYLLDTNIISEIGKATQCDDKVAKWYQTVSSSELYISALAIGEIRRGIENKRKQDPVKAEALESWLESIHDTYQYAILDVTAKIADEWGRMNSSRKPPVIDGLMATTAKVHQMTLVTRNVKDFAERGIQVLNPFDSFRLD